MRVLISAYFLLLCRHDFGKPDVAVVKTMFHWHAHAVGDLCFTTDGRSLEYAHAMFISRLTFSPSLYTYLQARICSLVGRSRSLSSGNWTHTRNSSVLVLAHRLLSLPAVLETNTSLCVFKAMVSRELSEINVLLCGTYWSRLLLLGAVHLQ